MPVPIFVCGWLMASGFALSMDRDVDRSQAIIRCTTCFNYFGESEVIEARAINISFSMKVAALALERVGQIQSF